MTELYSKLNDPILALIDLIGGGLILYWGHELFWKWSQNFSKTTTRFWGFLFLFTGLSILLFSTIHTFQSVMPEKIKNDLTFGLNVLFVTSITMLFFTGIKSFAHPRFQRLLYVLAILIYLTLTWLIANEFSMNFVIYYYYLAIVSAVLVYNFLEYSKYRKTSNKFVSFGLSAQLVSVILHFDTLGTSVIIHSQILFHLLIMFSIYLLYVGAKYSKDHVGY